MGRFCKEIKYPWKHQLGMLFELMLFMLNLIPLTTCFLDFPKVYYYEVLERKKLFCSAIYNDNLLQKGILSCYLLELNEDVDGVLNCFTKDILRA